MTRATGAVVYGNITAQSAACLGNAQGLDGTLHESLQVTDRRRWNYMVPEELQATATVREFGMAARAPGLVLIVALVQSMLQILLLVHLIWVGAYGDLLGSARLRPARWLR